ncbi:tRNA 2-selenouridine(34) synthase MnmH [Nemorincola caseinilytica]|uniref:tRNA 2-selenouridine(34) synthase MnmH n=1 Tax=Nemorincola caseinilytica TaxID=2054315 RepID=A0ABP8NBB0_9BACT
MRTIGIEEFLELAKVHPVIDVRSPGEYGHAHIPGAHNIALFSDEERKVVGTTYKQQSREMAIKIGLDHYGPKMRQIVETVEELTVTDKNARKTVLVHCWRGGMRSRAIAWLLDLYGFSVYLLQGGYKAYRNWTLAQFGKSYTLHVLGGYTGSGKTHVLHQLGKKGHTVVDLEGIARHRGSAFGGLDRLVQPSQEMFENLLALRLHHITAAIPGAPIWIEDESRRIGHINLPEKFWNRMRASTVIFLDIPFEERLVFTVKEYGAYPKEDLVNSIIRIQKRLGGLNTKTAINHLLENDIKECFRVLLRYYDKYYAGGLHDRQDIETRLHTIACTTVDAVANAVHLAAQLQDNG